MEKLSTTKFYNFLRSTTFILEVFSIRGHLQNLNFKYMKFKRSFRRQDDVKSKNYQLQSFITFRDLQLSF